MRPKRVRIRRVAMVMLAVAGVALPVMRATSGDGRIAPVRLAAAGPGRELPRLVWRSLQSGGEARRYAIYVPRAHAARDPLPVIVDLHGTGSHPEQELAVSGLARAADVRGFMVVMPAAVMPHPAGGAAWNVPPVPEGVDDVRFVADVIDDVVVNLRADPRRVYLTGFSGGARLACEVARRWPKRIAAVGAVGGLRAPRRAGPAVPVMAFHGTGDPVNPFGGGGPSYWIESVPAAFNAWVSLNRCGPGIDSVSVSAKVRRLSAVCAGRRESLLYVLYGAGHVWPGSRFPFPPERFGAHSDAVDASALMLDFFERHVLPQASRPPRRDGGAQGRRPSHCSLSLAAPRLR